MKDEDYYFLKDLTQEDFSIRTLPPNGSLSLGMSPIVYNQENYLKTLESSKKREMSGNKNNNIMKLKATEPISDNDNLNNNNQYIYNNNSQNTNAPTTLNILNKPNINN